MSELEDIESALLSAKKLITELEKQRDNTFVCFIEMGGAINIKTAYRMNKLLRRITRKENLDLLIESGGGDLNSAAKIASIFRKYFKTYTAIIPFFAKSAATFLALKADKIILCKAGELGPIDPQVKHPAADIWIPAHSIKEAIEFIESTRDPLVKLALAEKLDPWLIGAYKDAEKAAKQYVYEIFEKLQLDDDEKSEHTHVFTGKFRSHGYPIDIEVCKSLKLNLEEIDEKTERKIYELHEIYVDLYFNLKVDRLSIIQTSQKYDVEVNNENITCKLASE